MWMPLHASLRFFLFLGCLLGHVHGLQAQLGALAGESVQTCRDAPIQIPFRVIREGGDSLYVLAWTLPPGFPGELTVDVLEAGSEGPSARVGQYRGLSTPMQHAGFLSRAQRLEVQAGRFDLRGNGCRYLPFSISTATNADNVWDTLVQLVPDPRQLYLRYDTPADLKIQMADPMPGGYRSTPLHMDAWYLSRKNGRIRSGAWWLQNRTVQWLVERGQLIEIDPFQHYLSNGQSMLGKHWISKGRISKSAATHSP